MNKVLASAKVYVAPSKIPNAGRGVFARVAIKKGELIERCPVIEISADDAARVNETMIVTYMYYVGKNKERSLIVLGFGSLYNHAYRPNAIYKESHPENVVDFVALTEIKQHEEITVNYSQGNQKIEFPLWFKVAV